ncbi:hypothetical protein HPB48_006462 [Haemaphysalis longicornis]|uniref:Uncharacterized protein n=1 Tax=Haemaphysalis longicornis TaxID=44386 RepID=A0A9J6FMX2_HAELO|nr:hypothetical protein HPB48_006462 [Haemaphysalis longicornis]
MTAWLPRKHRCVEALYFVRGFLDPDRFAAPGPFPGLPPTGVRKITISDCHGLRNLDPDWPVILDAMGPVELQSLTCRALRVSDMFASKLAQLLSENAASITQVVFSQGAMGSRAADIFFKGISDCEVLRELRFDAKWMENCLTQRDVMALKEHRADQYMRLASLDLGHGKAGLPGVGDLLRKSTSLRKLDFCPITCEDITDCLEALESNSVLRELIISGYRLARRPSGHDMGQSLRSMLMKNQGLHSLTIVFFAVDYEAAALISEGLQQNSTLKSLCMSSTTLLFSAELVLYSALKTNTVVRLQLDGYGCSGPERCALNAEVKRNKWYSRVQLQWYTIHVGGLSESLLEQSLCPVDLHLDPNRFTDGSFADLCSAISSSPHLRELAVTVTCDLPTKVTSILKMLSEAQSLRCVSLHAFGPSILKSPIAASQGLRFSDSVEELLIRFQGMDGPLAELVALALETNKSLSKVTLVSEYGLLTERVAAIMQALPKNRFITDFSFTHPHWIVPIVRSSRAVQRNATHLQCAERFVLQQDLGKECGEAFELYEGEAPFLRRLMSTCGMTRAQAEKAVRSARQLISVNYLFVTQVVSQKLECFAADSTQIDKLNDDCWKAITRYLTVSDVLDD